MEAVEAVGGSLSVLLRPFAYSRYMHRSTCYLYFIKSFNSLKSKLFTSVNGYTIATSRVSFSVSAKFDA